MIHIDGSYGEGGGQILRTALSLSAITSKPIRIERIRANRSKPGLAIQHLTAVRAVAEICQAKVQGDAVGSTTLEFIPTLRPQAGQYTFDVEKTTGAGSAGAITLILQTVLLPLAFADGDSVVTLRGGTHVPHSPPATYIEQVYLPSLAEMGLQTKMQLKSWGWYPQGNGKIVLHIPGDSLPLTGIQLVKRGKLQQIEGLAVVTNLPLHIAERMAKQAENLLQQNGLSRAKIRVSQPSSIGSGTGIFLTAQYQNSRAGFSSLGRRGLPAEQVAEVVVQDLVTFQQNDAAIDPFLADQLLLPSALGTESSQYQTNQITQHLATNAWVINQFEIAQIHIDSESHLISVTPEQNFS